MEVSEANTFSLSSSQETHLSLDLETTRLTVDLDYGLGSRLEVGITVPVVNAHRGFLDEVINDFHEAFGFPGGGRRGVSNDRFRYEVVDGIHPPLRVAGPRAGLGDLQVRSRMALLGNGTQTGLVAELAVELPTGKTDRGLGSGGVDLQAVLEIDHRIAQWYFGLHQATTWIVDRDPRLGSARSAFWSAAGTLGFRPWPSLALLAQASGSTSPFGGPIPDLAGWSAELTTGLRVRVGGTAAEIYMIQDLTRENVPDVSFHLGLARQF